MDTLPLLLLLLSPLTAHAQTECNLAGFCVGTSLLASTDIPTQTDCVEICRDIPGAEYYIYDQIDGFCSCDEDCDSTNDCDTCTSGTVDCEAERICSEDGECSGILLGDVPDVPDAAACSAECDGSSICNYYTYFEDDEVCALYSTCYEILDDPCDDCVSSELGCEEDDGGDGGDGDGEGQLLLVVKAWSRGEMSVIDFSQEDGGSCSPRSVLPFVGDASLHAHFDGEELLMCNENDDNCRVYNPDADSWTTVDGVLKVEGYRYLPFALDLDDGRHWLSGGDGNLNYLKSSEFYTKDTGFQSGPDLPSETWEHCMVDLGDGQVFSLGGSPNDDTYIIDVNSGDVQLLPSLPAADLVAGACGLATKSDGRREVLAVGGRQGSTGSATSQSFIFGLDEGFWRPGPTLPSPRQYFRGVQLEQDGVESFFVLGGGEDAVGPYPTELIWYNPDSEDWEELPQSQALDNSDLIYVALFVPRDYLEC